jgi:5-methylcytosine-specific restriction endonuclease McrA
MARTKRCGGCRKYFRIEDMEISGTVVSYCSQDCYPESADRSAMTTVSKVVPMPPEARKNVFKRDNGTCQLCNGSGAPLRIQLAAEGFSLYKNDGFNVHHIIYRSQYGDHDVFENGVHDEMNLILLCVKCHDLVHRDKFKYQPMLLQMNTDRIDQ